MGESLLVHCCIAVNALFETALADAKSRTLEVAAVESVTDYTAERSIDELEVASMRREPHGSREAEYETDEVHTTLYLHL